MTFNNPSPAFMAAFEDKGIFGLGNRKGSILAAPPADLHLNVWVQVQATE